MDGQWFRWGIFLVELSFVEEGPRSGDLSRLEVHAATACLKIDFFNYETR